MRGDLTSLRRVTICVFLLGLLFTCTGKTCSALPLNDLRNRVTKEQAYEFGTEVELVAKKGDVVRLTLNENPSGRREIFLLPHEDHLQWSIPGRWGTGHASAGGGSYRVKTHFFGLGYGIVLGLELVEDADDTVTIKLRIDKEIAYPDMLKHRGEREARKRKVREKERGEANIISVDERLTGFIRLWSEIKYNFAFFDQVPQVDWDQVLEDTLPEVRKEQTTKEYYRLLERCVAQLRDGHTTVYPPSRLRPRGQLPLRITSVAGKPIISEVAEAASFAQPELKCGLEITHIDNRPIAEILEEEIYPYVADCTRQNRDRWAFRRLIRGETGTEVVVRVRDCEGKSHKLKLTYLRWDFPRPAVFEFCPVGESIAYVALNSFSSDKVSSSFKKAFKKIRQAKGLIIDVRRNSGGSSRVGYEIIGHLIDKPVPTSRWRTRKYIPAFRAWGRNEEWHEEKGGSILPKKSPYLGPVIVLTGPGTVSAGEDFCVALHASGRATLVGGKTAGTTGQPLVVKLPRGGKARICTKRDSYPDGREFVGVGVIPDAEVYATQESIATGRDVVLEKAIDILAGQAKTGPLDSSALSAEVISQHRKTLQQEQRGIAEILKAAKVQYNRLAEAYAEKDWKAVDAYGDDLCDLVREEFLGPFEVEFLRRRIKAEGRLNQQTEYSLLKWERRKEDIERFFGKKADMESLHRLIYEIEDLSDEIHDCARDGKFDGIKLCFPELERRWTLLLEYATVERTSE